MSLEGIREAYQQIQEQGGSYRGAGRAAFRDLNRKPIPTAPKAPMSAAGALGTTGDALGARDPGRDPVPAPAPRTVRGQGNRELRRPGDPGRTSQPTTRIKPKTPPAAAPTTSGSGSGSGSGSTGGGTRPTTPPGNSAASVNPGYERRTPTGPELRAAQAARAAATTAGKTKPEAEAAAVKAGVGVAKGTVKDPKIATDAARAADLAALRKAAKAETMAKSADTKPSYRSGRQRMRMMDSYDMVLDYLLSEGHAETVEEAHYIMMQLDQEHIQEVVEAYVVTNADKRGNTKAYQNYKAGMKNKITGEPLYKAAPHLKGV